MEHPKKTTAPRTVDVRRATEADVEELARVLARAFDDDPVSMFLLPSARRRPMGLRAFFRISLSKDLLAFGGVFTTTDLAGGALWAPPGKPPPAPLRAFMSLLPVIPFVAGRHPTRAVRFLAELEQSHPKEPHWYLASLGTDTLRQGQGVGSAMLQPVLHRCDLDGTRAYLESSKERNLPLYERHGFRVTREVSFGKGPRLWTMWREPQPPEV